MKKLAFMVFALGFLCSCSHESGKKEKANEAVITATPADNFTKIGELTIMVKSSDSFSAENFFDENKNVQVFGGSAFDKISKTEKTKTGFKKVFIYRLKTRLTKEQINEFVQSQAGNPMTVIDMAVLEEQHKRDLPTYVWIMGGDLTTEKLTILFSFDPTSLSPDPFSQFLLISSEPGYLWREEMAIAFYQNIN